MKTLVAALALAAMIVVPTAAMAKSAQPPSVAGYFFWGQKAPDATVRLQLARDAGGLQ
jgi:hypothetical protein